MEKLREIATVSSTKYSLPSGASLRVPTWVVRFVPANPPRLVRSTLSSTYTAKPLVLVDGDAVFGEIAIVRYLAKDGWHALWADTFHGKKFWQDMPDRSAPVDPPRFVKGLYDRIARLKGSASGCFDVVAWKDQRVAWLEYKGPKDKPNRNEALWIDAALKAGVQPDDLVFIGAAVRS